MWWGTSSLFKRLLNPAFDLTGKLSHQMLSSLNRLILHLGKITHKLGSYIIGLVKFDCQLGWIMKSPRHWQNPSLGAAARVFLKMDWVNKNCPEYGRHHCMAGGPRLRKKRKREKVSWAQHHFPWSTQMWASSFSFLLLQPSAITPHDGLYLLVTRQANPLLPWVTD